MKQVFGFLLILVGIAFGLWAGIWWAFVGGIVQVIQEIRAPELSALGVAIGITKVLCAGLIGWVAGLVAIFPGWVLLNS